MLYVQETYINATEGRRIGQSDIEESDAETPGEVYRDSMSEYGRCAGKVYIDVALGAPRPVGWVFQGLTRYEDTGEKYLREVWVTVHDKPDTVSRETHYRFLAS